jgi:hypothetical protein
MQELSSTDFDEENYSVELLINWHTSWLLLRMLMARVFRQEFVKSPSFVFE